MRETSFVNQEHNLYIFKIKFYIFLTSSVMMKTLNFKWKKKKRGVYPAEAIFRPPASTNLKHFLLCPVISLCSASYIQNFIVTSYSADNIPLYVDDCFRFPIHSAEFTAAGYGSFFVWSLGTHTRTHNKHRYMDVCVHVIWVLSPRQCVSSGCGWRKQRLDMYDSCEYIE